MMPPGLRPWPALLAVVAAATGAAVVAWPGLDAGRRLSAGAVRPVRRIDLLWLAVAVTAVAASAVGWRAAAMVAPAGAAGVLWWRRWCARRVEARLGGDAADAFAAVADELRAGRGLSAALRAAADQAGGELSTRLQAAAVAVADTDDPASALVTGGDRVSRALRPLGAVLVCALSGAALADVIDRVADAARAEQRGLAALHAELAGPRATAVLLAVLPVVGLGMAAAAGARPFDVLLHTRLGAGCLVAGGLLDGLGVWWSGRIARSAAKP